MVSLRSISKSGSKSLSLLLNRKFWGSAVFIFVFAVIIGLFLAFQQGWFSMFEGLDNPPTLLKKYPDIIPKIDKNIIKVQNHKKEPKRTNMTYGNLLTELTILKRAIQQNISSTNPNPGFNEFKTVYNTVNASKDTEMKNEMKMIWDKVTQSTPAPAPASTPVAPIIARTPAPAPASTPVAPGKSLTQLFPTIKEELTHMFNVQHIELGKAYYQLEDIAPIGNLFHLSGKVVSAVDKTDGSGQAALKALVTGFENEKINLENHYKTRFGVGSFWYNLTMSLIGNNLATVKYMDAVVNGTKTYIRPRTLFELNRTGMDAMLAKITTSTAFLVNPTDDANLRFKKENLGKLFASVKTEYKNQLMSHEAFHKFMRYAIYYGEDLNKNIHEFNYFKSLLDFGNSAYRDRGLYLS